MSQLETTLERNLHLNDEVMTAEQISTQFFNVENVEKYEEKQLSDIVLSNLNSDEKTASTKLLSAYLDNLKIEVATSSKIGGIKVDCNILKEGNKNLYNVTLCQDFGVVKVPWTDTSVFIGPKEEKGEESCDYSEALEKEDDKLYLKISQLSSELKCVNEDWVNSSINTNTAHFKGTYTQLSDLENIVSAKENDYAFICSSDNETNGSTRYDRYKYNSDKKWAFEYTLNNSSFTNDQWKAINSKITESDVTEFKAKPTTDEVNQQISSHQIPNDSIPSQPIKFQNMKLAKFMATYEATTGMEPLEFYVILSA